MPEYKIPDLSARARTRIARTEQVRALAPFPARHDGNHWGLNRVAWVHPRIPGRADLLLGKDNASLARAREALADAGAPLDAIESLTLDELVITPDLISGGPEGFNIRTNIQEPRPGVADNIVGKYEPTGDVEVLTVQNSVGWGAGSAVFVSRSFSGPCYVRDFNISMTSTNNAGYSTITVTNVGQLWAGIPSNGTIAGSTGVRTINKLVETGAVQMIMNVTNESAGSSMDDLIFATCVVERARRIA